MTKRKSSRLFVSVIAMILTYLLFINFIGKPCFPVTNKKNSMDVQSSINDDYSPKIAGEMPNNKMIKPNELATQNIEISKIRLLTAFSGDHFGEALRSCKSISKLTETKNWKPGFMIVYLLKNDVSAKQLNEYFKECPFVTIRIFGPAKYPNFVRDSYEYRWKPLIIAEVLEEVEKIFYFDSSVFFAEKAGESIMDIFEKMDTKFSKCGIRTFLPTGHSIYSATHPNMLKYFNFPVEIAKETEMYAATYLVATKNAKKIIEPWTKCALEKMCMAPEGSNRKCDGEKLSKGEYANCNRYDQSTIALLLYNCSKNASDYFEQSSMTNVERWGNPPP